MFLFFFKFHNFLTSARHRSKHSSVSAFNCDADFSSAVKNRFALLSDVVCTLRTSSALVQSNGPKPSIRRFAPSDSNCISTNSL